VTASFEDARISVIVPRTMAHHWASTDDVGLQAEQEVGGEVLQILIEKDFRCLHRGDAERDADAYPNSLEEDVPET